MEITRRCDDDVPPLTNIMSAENGFTKNLLALFMEVWEKETEFDCQHVFWNSYAISTLTKTMRTWVSRKCRYSFEDNALQLWKLTTNRYRHMKKNVFKI